VQLSSCQFSGWGSFAEVNRAERKAGHSSISKAKVVNEWSYASTPSIYLYVYKVEAVGNVRLVGAPKQNRTGNIYKISRLRQNARLITIIHQKLLVVQPFLQCPRCQSSIPRQASACCRFLLRFTLNRCQPVLADVPAVTFLFSTPTPPSVRSLCYSIAINSCTINLSLLTREGEI